MWRKIIQYIALVLIATYVVKNIATMNIIDSVSILTGFTLSFIALLYELNENKINKIFESHESKTNQMFESYMDNIESILKQNIDNLDNLIEFKEIARIYTINKSKYSEETGIIFTNFKKSMSKLENDIIPILNRNDYIARINQMFGKAKKYDSKIIYLSLLNFEIWSPEMWKGDTFKNLCKAKKDAHSKGTIIITNFVYSGDTSIDLNNVISDHKEISYNFKCTHALNSLEDKQCGMFLLARNVPNKINHENIKSIINEIDFDFDSSVAFVERDIYGY